MSALIRMVVLVGAFAVSCSIPHESSRIDAQASEAHEEEIVLPHNGDFVGWLKVNQDTCGGWGVSSRRVAGDGRDRTYQCTLGPSCVHSAFVTGLALHGIIEGLSYHVKYTPERESDESIDRALKCIVANGFADCNEDREMDLEDVLGVATCTNAICDALFIDRSVTGARRAAESGVRFLSSATSKNLPWNRWITPSKSSLELCAWTIYALTRAKMVGIEFDRSVANRIISYIDDAVDEGCGSTWGSSVGSRANNGSTPLAQRAIPLSWFSRVCLRGERTDIDRFRIDYARLWMRDYFESLPKTEAMKSELEWLIAGELATLAPAGGPLVFDPIRTGWIKMISMMVDDVSHQGLRMGVRELWESNQTQKNAITYRVATLAILGGMCQ